MLSVSHVCSCVHTRAQQHTLSVCPRCTGTHSPTFSTKRAGSQLGLWSHACPTSHCPGDLPQKLCQARVCQGKPSVSPGRATRLQGGLLAWSSSGGSRQWGAVHSWRRSWNPDITFSMLGGAGLGSCQEQQWVKARPPCSAVGASLKLAQAPGPLGLSVLLPALLLSHGCRGTLKIGQHGQPGYY